MALLFYATMMLTAKVKPLAILPNLLSPCYFTYVCTGMPHTNMSRLNKYESTRRGY